ncbi:Integral membrane protein [hydrothermal vent metagenome]|uniref:Integral membrane protein n=1 Tax=hydrothermal vent metagenome TaxID=652676 RepID=A0A3B0T5L6_9ZZZZ
MENRNFLHYIFIALKGMAMGVAELVPGVSGGTIAFVAGIYEEFITSINNLNLATLKTWRKEGFKAFWQKLNGNFSLALLIGMLTSIFLFSTTISWLLENHPIPTWSFFFGLVLASVVFVGKAIKKWNMITVLLLVLGAAVAYFITTLPPTQNSDGLPFLFLSGAVAICAMILPGISGAFILVLLGSYKTILDAVHDRDIKIILAVGAGAIFGLLSFAKILKWMFTSYKNSTLAVLTGFILGSLNKIWPWKKILETKTIGHKAITLKEQSVSPFTFEGDHQIMYAIIAAIIGFSLIFILERTASKE